MNKLRALLILTLISTTLFGQQQLSLPDCPSKLEFANINISLNEEARDLVNAEIKTLLTPQNAYLEQKLERMQWYFPIIEKILIEEDVPEDFKYIAVVESNLLPEAISTSNAIGFWQFKEATAKDLGLRVDNFIDERKSIFESTRAAALYLKKSNIIHKNWVSSILAHNMGPTGAMNSIPSEWVFANEVAIDASVNRYLIKAIAHRIAYEHRLNRIKAPQKQLVQYPTKGKSLAEIAVELTIDINDLRKYNGWLYGPAIPEEKTYTVLFPVLNQDLEAFNDKIVNKNTNTTKNVGFPQLKRITMISTSPDDPIYYQINGKKGVLAQPGDQLIDLAQKSKVKLYTFLAYNDLTDKDFAKDGQIYYLQKKAKKAKVAQHVTKENQTSWEISQMYGIRLKSLLKYNRITPDFVLQTGRVMNLQKIRSKNAPVEIIQQPKPSDKKPFEEDILSSNPEPIKESKNPYNTEKTDQYKKPIEPVFQEEVKVADTKKAEIIEDKKPEKAIIKPEEKVITSIPNTKKVETPNSIPANSSKPVDLHLVKVGETFYSISKKYNLTVAELKSLNNLGPNDVLRTDMSLKVRKLSEAQEKIVKNSNLPVLTESKPSKETKAVELPKAKSTPIAEKTILKPVKKEEISTKENEDYGEPGTPVKEEVEEEIETIVTNSTGYHIVQKSETAFSISKKYGISVNELLKLNNLATPSISLGQKLKIGKVVDQKPSVTKPVVSTKSESPIKANAVPSTHIVAPGETLYSVARKYSINVKDLKELNKLVDLNIKVGQTLKIK
jgi:membrane-bound lytic murein transglycosylase D